MSLAKQIAQASAEVGGALSTDKVNTEQRYGYISSDKILTVCGQALARHGVAVFPAVVAEVVDMVEYKQGRSRYDAAVTFHMHVSGDEGEPMVLPWVGRGSDYSVPDKALYKAITSGHKYFLMKLLNVGAGNEDGEHDVPNIDMGAIPEDTAGAMATPQRSNGKPAPKAKAPSAQNGNSADEKTIKLLNAMGQAAFYGDWKKKHDELCAKLGITSTSEIATTDATTTITWLRGLLTKNLDAGMVTIYGDAEDAKADFIETVTEWKDKQGNVRQGVRTLDEATDWNLVFLTTELHKVARDAA